MRRLVLLGRWEEDANFLVPCTEFVPFFLAISIVRTFTFSRSDRPRFARLTSCC